MFDFSKITSSPWVFFLLLLSDSFIRVHSELQSCAPIPILFHHPLSSPGTLRRPPPSYFIIFYKRHTEVRISCLGAGEDLMTQAKAAHQWLHHWRNETPLPIATNCQQFLGKGWNLVPRPAPLSLMKCWPAQAFTGILQGSTGAELLSAMVVPLL